LRGGKNKETTLSNLQTGEKRKVDEKRNKSAHRQEVQFNTASVYVCLCVCVFVFVSVRGCMYSMYNRRRDESWPALSVCVCVCVSVASVCNTRTISSEIEKEREKGDSHKDESKTDAQV
jgi:hypothetical protein